MTIKKSFVLFFPCILFFSFFIGMSFGARFTEAKVVITEIMYDDKGSDVDWIEIYNDGEEIDITSLKLLISNSTSNHAIKAYYDVDTLKTGEYGLIVVNSQVASFVEKWGGGLNVFTSSFSLPNVTEEQTAMIALNAGDKSIPIDSVTYEELFGAKGNGDSLQLLNDTWESSLPTPGLENFLSSNLIKEDGLFDEEDDDGGEEKISKVLPKINAKVFVKNVVFAGEPISLRAAILVNEKETYYRGKYYWNFGDGSSLVEMNHPEKLEHVYYYPGDYALFMKYYPDVFTEDPQFETRINIKAMPIKVSIKNAGNHLDYFGEENIVKDFGIELTNDSSYEIDISSWSIVAGKKFFQFPPDSVILPKKSLIVPGSLTGFIQGDEKDLKLYSSIGKIISHYQ